MNYFNSIYVIFFQSLYMKLVLNAAWSDCAVCALLLPDNEAQVQAGWLGISRHFA